MSWLSNAMNLKGTKTQQYSLGTLSDEQNKSLNALLPNLQGKIDNPDYAGANRFFESTIQNPTMFNLERQGIPGVEAQGSLHSSSMNNNRDRLIGSVGQGLSGQRQQAMAGEDQATMDYIKQLLAAINVGSKENIADKPDTLSGIGNTISSLRG